MSDGSAGSTSETPCGGKGIHTCYAPRGFEKALLRVWSSALLVLSDPVLTQSVFLF